MFGDTYELRNLYDIKNDRIRGKLNDTSDGTCESNTTESAFLGPVLWDDTYTINDLDNINLAEFSPTVLHESIQESQTWDEVFPENHKAHQQITCCCPSGPPKALHCKIEKNSNENATWPMAPDLDTSVSLLSAPKSVTRKPSRVPVEQKNEKYWNRRMKNNASAKRSRDARRLMESQVYAKAAMLERENAQMRLELDRLAMENKTLRELLASTAPCHVHHDSTEAKLSPLNSIQEHQSAAPDTSVASSYSPYRLIQPR